MSRSNAKTAILRLVVLFVAVFVVSVAPRGWMQAKAATADAEQTRISIAHFAPFSSDRWARTRVAVRIDGQTVTDSLYYLNVITGVRLAAGQHTLVLEPTDGWGVDEDAEATFIAADGMDITFALVGGTADVAPQLVEYANGPVGDPQAALLRLHNFAPVAFNSDTEVTLCDQAKQPFSDLDNVRFPNTSVYSTVPSGTHILHLSSTASTCQAEVISDFEVTLEDGQVVELYFVGLGTDLFPLQVVQYDNDLGRRWNFATYLPTILAGGD